MSDSEIPHDLDVVLITALKDELDAVRAVDDGAIDDCWDERRDSSSFRIEEVWSDLRTYNLDPRWK